MLLAGRDALAGGEHTRRPEEERAACTAGATTEDTMCPICAEAMLASMLSDRAVPAPAPMATPLHTISGTLHPATPEKGNARPPSPTPGADIQ